MKAETGFVVSYLKGDQQVFRGRQGAAVGQLEGAQVYKLFDDALAQAPGLNRFQIHPVMIVPMDLSDEQREQIRKARAARILRGASPEDIEALRVELLK